MTESPKGFSGLREYASANKKIDAGTPLFQESPEETEYAKQHMELIELSKWPTLPMPWSSTDEGETWVWGDYFLTLQKQPRMMQDFLAGIVGGGEKLPAHPMIYHYAMTAFYRVDKNPHGPSHRPVMVISLEQLDYSKARKIYQQQGKDASLFPADEPMGPVMVGLFTNDNRFSLSGFAGDLTSQNVKRYFFETLEKWLGVSGKPKLIGTLEDAHGHPETGMPKKEKKKSGCTSVLLAFVVMLSLFISWLIA